MSSPTSGGYSEFYHHWCKFQECIGEPPFKPAVLFKLKASPVDEHRALAAVSTGHRRNIRRNPEKFHRRRPCTVLPDASGESELVLVPSLPSDVDVEHHDPECDIFHASRRYYRLWYCVPAGADGKRHPGLEFSLKIFEEKADWFSISDPTEVLHRTVDYRHDLLPQEVRSYQDLVKLQGAEVPYSYGIYECRAELNGKEYNLGSGHLMEFIRGPSLEKWCSDYVDAPALRTKLLDSITSTLDGLESSVASKSHRWVFSRIHPTDLIIRHDRDSLMAVVVNFREALHNGVISAEGVRLWGEMPILNSGKHNALSAAIHRRLWRDQERHVSIQDA